MKKLTYFDCLTLAGKCAANDVIPKDEKKVVDLAVEIKEHPEYRYALDIAITQNNERT